MPAAFARAARSAGSHASGENVEARAWYSSGVTDWQRGSVNAPPTSGHETSSPRWLAWSQWMNIPKRASSNQARSTSVDQTHAGDATVEEEVGTGGERRVGGQERDGGWHLLA